MPSFYLKHRLQLWSLFACYSLGNLSGCEPKQPPSTDHSHHAAAENEALQQKAGQLFRALPAEADSPQDNPTTPDKIKLGKALFHDPRLSKSGSISCSSCHNLASYGVDNRATSVGHGGLKAGERNAPTVLNASLHFSQFWDGRAEDLEAQAKGPILNPSEMGMVSEAVAVERIKSIPEYKQAFESVFSEGSNSVSYANIARAIAAFERTLLTPAPFDRYLQGESEALSAEAKEGLKTFISYGCTACHNGVGVGGALYQKFGVINPYAHQKDTGRFAITKNPEDKYVFKVPSLRNIERTAPYFHDGQVPSLEEAVITMAKTQLGKEMPGKDAQKILKFLESLTGTLPSAALTSIALPTPTKPESQ
jgi:cytochrome c peroxidase